MTDWGRTLEPILLALGHWASNVPLPPEATLSASAVMMFLRGTVHPKPETSSTVYGLQLNDRMWTVRTVDGEIDVHYGEPADPDVVLRTDPQTLNALLTEPHILDTALSEAGAVVEGDLSALRDLLQTATIPAPNIPRSTARSS